MSDNKAAPRSGGPGFMSLLGLLFIGLKLAGFIDWSWWAVLSPIWLMVVFWLAVLVAAKLIIDAEEELHVRH